jgi:hypothetical protein
MSIPTLADARPQATHRVSRLDYARARDIDLFSSLVRYRGDSVPASGRDRALAHARALAYARARGLRTVGVAPSAAGLLAAAAWLLPAADRARYGEEYRSELWDLAQSGAGRLRQLGYALRQLRRALPACLALRSPRHGSAAR